MPLLSSRITGGCANGLNDLDLLWLLRLEDSGCLSDDGCLPALAYGLEDLEPTRLARGAESGYLPLVEWVNGPELELADLNMCSHPRLSACE